MGAKNQFKFPDWNIPW